MPKLCNCNLFQEEISACAAVQTRYVMGALQLCTIHNSFALYNGDAVPACCANKADCQ